MSIWVKICGNTSLEDAQLAADAGADAVGFVFAPSPRKVTAQQVAAITSRLPASLEKIGVFVDADLDSICSTVRNCGLTGVQLHFDGGAHLAEQLRSRLGSSLRILQVVHFRAGGDVNIADEVNRHARNPHIDGVLVDSRTAAAVGGTGQTFHWAEARRTVFADGAAVKLIAAGGLNAANVAEAIAVLHPWGVDVVSGVEAAPGRKDPFKVEQFVAKARAARA